MDALDFGSWVDVATVVGGFATALAAALAIVGIPIAYVQIQATKKIQREATAKNLYRQYLEDAVNRPDLVVPDLAKLKSDGRWIQYELFVAHMLYSLEEILENIPTEEWRQVARGQIARHIEYFKSEDFKPKRGYYVPAVIALIDSF